MSLFSASRCVCNSFLQASRALLSAGIFTAIDQNPSTKRHEIVSSALMLAATLAMISVYGFTQLSLLIPLLSIRSSSLLAQTIVSLLIGFVFLWGNVLYQVTRFGHLRRARRWKMTYCSATTLAGELPLTVLVPAYREELHVIWMTMMSAALMDYSDRRVVLLLDDPPETNDAAACHALARARAIPEEMTRLFRPVNKRLQGYADAGLKLLATDQGAAAKMLAVMHDDVANFLEDVAKLQAAELLRAAEDHVKHFFIEQVLRAPALAHRAEAQKALTLSRQDLLTALLHTAQRLAVSLDCFERKRFENLPHAANKAANLNAYLGLIGNTLEIAENSGAMTLHNVGAIDPSKVIGRLEIPHATFVMTLDADSMVLTHYARRLVAFLQDPSNARVAIAQTPYSSYPCAPGVLERVAGATTDLQYVVHQGMAEFNSAYWVGANAVLRMKALKEIATLHCERGYAFPWFIQDRTVIEDTGSTIDLIRRGWIVHNHPERLAFSATPHDFGALLIQRRRWSNGGLVILPSLFGFLCKKTFGLSWLAQAFLRIHYLASPALASAGILTLMLVPLDDQAISPWLPATALTYFFAYACDLRRHGYRRRDILGVYALNMVLLPVVFGGVLKSLDQILRGVPTPFARTPKIAGCTGIPLRYIIAPVLLCLVSTESLIDDLSRQRIMHAAFSLWNVVMILGGCIAFMGMPTMAADVARAIRLRLRYEPWRQTPAPASVE